jgi:hypothetical protein
LKEIGLLMQRLTQENAALIKARCGCLKPQPDQLPGQKRHLIVWQPVPPWQHRLLHGLTRGNNACLAVSRRFQGCWLCCNPVTLW